MTQAVFEFLNRGGPALWAIAILSVLTLALILWKLWHLSRLGAWTTRPARAALHLWADNAEAALQGLSHSSGLRGGVLATAMRALQAGQGAERAQQDCARDARSALMQARSGLRGLDLVVTIAPLIGLLGTVLGMIDAFQALQDSGNRADPAALAGGIWQALLTTAAGMAVAIPASVALSYFDGVADRLAHDLEDLATRLFLQTGQPQQDAA